MSRIAGVLLGPGNGRTDRRCNRCFAPSGINYRCDACVVPETLRLRLNRENYYQAGVRYRRRRRAC